MALVTQNDFAPCLALFLTGGTAVDYNPHDEQPEGRL